jgi:hypothetical protein
MTMSAPPFRPIRPPITTNKEAGVDQFQNEASKQDTKTVHCLQRMSASADKGREYYNSIDLLLTFR